LTRNPFNNSNIEKAVFFTKLCLFFIILVFLITFKYSINFFNSKSSTLVTTVFHRLVLWLININVVKEGYESKNRKGILFVSNHLSYIDIPILGSLLPLKFVARADIKEWPILGKLAQIGDTIFVERLKKTVSLEKDVIEKTINNGEKVILFPEGTTSDGNRVLDFKSSLMSSVENKDYIVQPVVISYHGINGVPLTRWLKPIIAWYGDMEFKTHLINLIGLSSISAKVKFLSPINSKDFNDRKSMTNFLQNVINNSYSKNING